MKKGLGIEMKRRAEREAIKYKVTKDKKEAILLRQHCLVTSTVKAQMTWKSHCIWHVTLVMYGVYNCKNIIAVNNIIFFQTSCIYSYL